MNKLQRKLKHILFGMIVIMTICYLPVIVQASQTDSPQVLPTATPQVLPTASPQVLPTASPQVLPTASPQVLPTATPQVLPTATPTVPKVTGIKITSFPTKLNYVKGEIFDPKGLVVVAYLDNDTTQIVEPESILGFDGKVGKNTISITYKAYVQKFTVEVVPGLIMGIDSITNSTSSFTLMWEELKEATGYEILKLNTAFNSYELAYTTSETSFTVKELPSGTIQEFLMRAYTLVDGVKYYSAPSSKIQAATKPDKVVGLTAIEQTSTSIKLNWNAVSGATAYEIYCYNSAQSKYELVSVTEESTFTDKYLNQATRRDYRVRAYTLDNTITGEYSDMVITSTNPGKTSIQVKGGSEVARVTWTSMSNASGYIVYMSDGDIENYVEVGRFDSLALSYIQTGLIAGRTYRFKVMAYKNVEGVDYFGEFSGSKNVAIVKLPDTSTKAKYFTTKKKFIKSSAYKKFSDFKKYLNYNKSVVIPGLANTNIFGFVSKKMCPQAITFTDKYLLLSAYDQADEENSVIYVIDKNTKKYLATIVLPNKAHTGGITYDGTYVWVAYSSSVGCIRYSNIESAIATGQKVSAVNFEAICDVKTKASFMTYYRNQLWVGEYSESKTRNMFGYTIDNTTGTIQLTKKSCIKVPSKTQGVTFKSNGTMIISRSCQMKTSLRVYISQLRVYKPSWSKATATGYIAKNAVKNVVTMPPMAEGIAISGKYTYVVFESAAFGAADYKVDRIGAFTTSKIIKKSKKK